MCNRIKHMHARLNIARQIELSSAAVWHGTEHVSDAYSTVSTHLWNHFILKNHTKSKLDCNIVGYTQIINHNRSNIALCKLVLTSLCCKHFMYICIHLLCTLFCVHLECVFLLRGPLLFIVQNSDRILL